MVEFIRKKAIVISLIMFVLAFGCFTGCIVVNVGNDNNFNSLTFSVESKNGFIDIDEAAEKLQSKLEGFGIKKVEATPDGDKNVVVKFPEDYTGEYIKSLVAIEPKEFRVTDEGNAKTYLTNGDIVSVSVGMNDSGKYVLAVTLTAEGGHKFAIATGEAAASGEALCIYLGEELLMRPNVSQQIIGTQFSIEDYDTYEEAEGIALLMKAKDTGYYTYITQ